MPLKYTTGQGGQVSLYTISVPTDAAVILIGDDMTRFETKIMNYDPSNIVYLGHDANVIADGTSPAGETYVGYPLRPLQTFIDETGTNEIYAIAAGGACTVGVWVSRETN